MGNGNPSIDVRTRFRGCLLGLACGDAVGTTLNSLQGTIVAGTAQTLRKTKPQSGATGLGYRQCPPPLGLYDSDNLQASAREHLRETMTEIESAQRELDSIKTLNLVSHVDKKDAN